MYITLNILPKILPYWYWPYFRVKFPCTRLNPLIPHCTACLKAHERDSELVKRISWAASCWQKYHCRVLPLALLLSAGKEIIERVWDSVIPHGVISCTTRLAPRKFFSAREEDRYGRSKYRHRKICRLVASSSRIAGNFVRSFCGVQRRSPYRTARTGRTWDKDRV